ncbi:MAG: AMP-binding protein [Clostridia bacterium]|nr:AMP-binding protein [Clostridia bacterium]
MGMLLDRYLPRQAFDSYEDFKANYRVHIPENFNFAFDVVDEWARLDEAKRALVWCDDHGDEKTFTFGDISRLSSRAAHFFTGLGIRRGDVVLLILRRRWEYWVCAMALCKMGVLFVPSSLQLTAKDIAYRVNIANVKAIVCVADDFVLSQVEQARPDCPSLEHVVTAAGRRAEYPHLTDAINDYPDVFERPSGAAATRAVDPMFLYFTSGTTGMPKMVQHNYAHPLGHIVTAKYWQRVQEGKLHMSVSDSGWAKFGWGKIYGQWICGAVVFAYDMDKFIAANLLEKLERYRVTTFCAPPTMLRFMLLEDMRRFDLSSIETCCIAGEPLSPEVYRQWQEVTGLALYEGFGQSEGSVLIANFPWFEPKPGSTGKPSPLYDIEVVNPDGNRCEDGEEGEIVVRGIRKEMPCGLFTGYYLDPGLTERVMGGGNYNTGDVAWRDSDGYHWFVGRSDDVIKCSGYRIGPFEVESALMEHEAVVECAVTAAPDPARGQVVKATVVLRQGCTPSDKLIKSLQDHVKRVTAPYKYPRILEFVSELPKTVSGKIRRAEIRESGTAGESSSANEG